MRTGCRSMSETGSAEIRDCYVCRAANNDMGCEDQRTMELQARVKKLVETGGLQ